MPHDSQRPARSISEMLEEALEKLDYIAALILAAHREEVANVDSEAARMRRQLAQVVAGLGETANAEQVARLKAHAAKLTALADGAELPTNPS